jgi:hypothetical protein
MIWTCYYINVKLKKVKMTNTLDRIIYFYDTVNINKFLSSEPLFKGCKRVLLNMTSDIMVVNGMGPKIAQQYMQEPEDRGIVETMPFNLKVEDNKLFKDSKKSFFVCLIY